MVGYYLLTCNMVMWLKLPLWSSLWILKSPAVLSVCDALSSSHLQLCVQQGQDRTGQDRTGQRTLWNSVYLNLCSEWKGGMVSYTGPLSASDIIGNCGLLSVQVSTWSLSPVHPHHYISPCPSLWFLTFPPLFPFHFSNLLPTLVPKYNYILDYSVWLWLLWCPPVPFVVTLFSFSYLHC